MRFDLRRRLAAEAFGTAVLAMTVVGSGIMASRLTGDGALALLCNTLATGAILVVLIMLLGPVSGAHLNPAVTLIFALGGDLRPSEGIAYGVAQSTGGIAGVFLAHAMFGLPILQLSTTIRTGSGQWLAETVATFALGCTILCGQRLRPHAVPFLVGLTIAAAYWFTASTSFANPALALARSLSDTFAGIRPADVPAFALAELLGASASTLAVGWLFAGGRAAVRPASTE